MKKKIEMSLPERLLNVKSKWNTKIGCKKYTMIRSSLSRETLGQCVYNKIDIDTCTKHIKCIPVLENRKLISEKVKTLRLII